MPEDGHNDEGVDFAEDAAGAEDLEGVQVSTTVMPEHLPLRKS